MSEETTPKEERIPYLWGQALAIFKAETPGGLSAGALTNAVERPLFCLPKLVRQAKPQPELEEMLAKLLGKIEDLPERFSLADQGQVYLGYYSLIGDLPPSPSTTSKRRNTSLDWETIDWSLADSEISKRMGVTQAAVSKQRRKRGL